jgi:hypothetical protein
MNLNLSAALSNKIERTCVATIGKPFHLEGLFHLQAPPGKSSDLHLWGIDPNWKTLSWNFKNAAPAADAIPCTITKSEETKQAYLGITALRSNLDVHAAAGGHLFIEQHELWASAHPRLKLIAYEGLPIEGRSGVFSQTSIGSWIQRGNILLLEIENTATKESACLPIDWPGWKGFFESSSLEQKPPKTIKVNVDESQLWETVSG